MTPPDQLRRAAELLEQARLLPPGQQRDAMLAEVHDICANTAVNIREQLSPGIESLGAAIGRAARGR